MSTPKDKEFHSFYEKEKAAKACWQHYIKTHKLRKGVPKNPDVVYKDEWKGWADWLDWVGIEMN